MHEYYPCPEGMLMFRKCDVDINAKKAKLRHAIQYYVYKYNSPFLKI